MCGIVGVINLTGRPASPVDVSFLHEASRQIEHRGPDEQRLFCWRNVAFLFRRLSIVDPLGGSQPFETEDRAVVAITNGEIYNHLALRTSLSQSHRLRSNCDCEVVPHLYQDRGLAFVDVLNGEFATALLDKRKRKVLLCRDRLGIRPLFYFKNSEVLVFGSEIKAVLAHPAVPREFDWTRALTYRSIREELSSFFRGIEHMPAGSMLEIDLRTGRCEEHVYWDPSTPRPPVLPSTASPEEWTALYGSVLEDAVQLRLMAQADLGIFLSGGVDSAAIAFHVAKRQQVPTFTVVSESTIANGDASAAAFAAQALGLDIHQVLIDCRSLALGIEDWKRILWKVETPLADGEQLYKYLLHAYAKRQYPRMKVILTGQGSDEFNGGYSRSLAGGGNGNWDRFEHMLREEDRRRIVRTLPGVECYETLRIGDRHILRENFLAETTRPRVQDFWHSYQETYRHIMQMYQLWHEDRTAAANSIENRAPFLDHRLVEIAYMVPPRLYSTLLWDKAILRRSLQGLPTKLTRRHKVPFFHGPEERCTRQLMYRIITSNGCALVEEALDSADRDGGVLDREVTRKLLAAIPTDSSYEKVDHLLELINMGLLSAMARDLPRLSSDLACEVRRVDGDGVASNANQSCRFTSLSETPLIDEYTVLRFREGVQLVRCEAGDPNVTERGHYIVINDCLQYVLSESKDEWAAVLGHIDGRRSIWEACERAHVPWTSICADVVESIRCDVLAICAPQTEG
jgi:asparagine synthase (glutamine-hydrolysing)